MESPSMEDKQLRVTKRTLQTVLKKFQRELELLQDRDDDEEKNGGEEREENQGPSSETACGYESDELCDLVKAKVESPDFLDKLGRSYISVTHNMFDESTTWDMINANELWEGKCSDGEKESENNGFVLVKQEDVVDGIATFMAAYLLSMEATKEFSPDQLQKVLCKTFSLKKKKSKLRMAWDRSVVVYNVASWSTTAFGMYQNPAVFKAASAAVLSSCRVISKLL